MAILSPGTPLPSMMRVMSPQKASSLSSIAETLTEMRQILYPAWISLLSSVQVLLSPQSRQLAVDAEFSLPTGFHGWLQPVQELHHCHTVLHHSMMQVVDLCLVADGFHHTGLSVDVEGRFHQEVDRAHIVDAAGMVFVLVGKQ